MDKTIFEVVHESATGLYDSGLMDTTTMRKFDAMCLPKIKNMNAQEIKKVRLREKVSQTVFAMYLNTSTSTIKQWERGMKHPKGTSLKLLNMVSKKGIGILIV